ncbi:pilus assembly protein TadG-related protein [Phyllobacterium sp. TAF24]|uniref:TadE/TadG family type IV pilus assembly protein n=1 Tax=unclassified Phyllobacterium TaxID=2638441 RepID=UPI00088B291E|nr:TadE/TadG family type IV pilus assembly protein [Phyllobacterium sp. OV277]SDO43303.1 Flp pilus assembly protein TadG [Phyllobacterium sp. OV277]
MKKFRDFLKDTSGATALTFGLLLVPLLGVTGLAVDYTRASSDHAELQNAADAAVLWGASTYNGSNLPDVKARIQQSLRANLPGFDASGATYDVSVTDDVPARIKLSLARPMKTTFMQVLSQNSMDIGTTSTASGALTPKQATIKVTNVKGIYYKKISIIVVGADGAEKQVGSIEYKYINNTGTSNPAVGSTPLTFDLGTYKSFYFTMIVKKDGCAIGMKPSGRNCVDAPKVKSNDPKNPGMVDDPKYQITPVPNNLNFDNENKFYGNDTTYAFLVKSNRARDAWRFVEGGGQSTVPKDSDTPVIMDKLMNCDGSVKKHGWEDGGGGTPDFEYTLTTGCAFDYSQIRLTQ